MRAQPRAPIVVLALGNDILGDDAVGLVAARALVADLDGVGGYVDVVEAPGAGFSLLETLEGYRFALLLDALVAGDQPAGTVVEFTPAAFDQPVGPSPHAASLPEVMALARALEVPFPADIRILAVVVNDPYRFGEGLSPAAAAAVPKLVRRAQDVIRSWIGA